jgi:hypothetical protein
MIKIVCEVGYFFKPTKKLSYLSTDTFLDYDAVIISLDSSGIFQNFNTYSRQLYEKRKEDLIEFIKHKKTPLIVFAPQPEQFNFSNSGRVQLDFFIPSGSFSVEQESGEGKEIIPKTIFVDFFKKYLNNFYYRSYFKTYTGIPILNTPHTKKVLSYYNDNVIFLPALRNNLNEQEFLQDLINVAVHIRNKVGKISQPDWAKKYFLPNERKIFSEVLAIESEIESLSNSLSEKKEYAETFAFRKQVFTGYGTHLEDEIKKMFSELGFKILESDPNRDDITVEYNGKVAVIEIKGVNGSSGEGQAAQLEKWATMHYEKHQVHPKAILIVNSFKEKPLGERKEETFPHQMLKYSISREHCLISTLQFLGLYYDALNSDKKDDLIDTLFQSIGIYKGYEDWTDFIEFDEVESQQ